MREVARVGDVGDGQAVGVKPKLIHIPSERIAEYDASWGAGLLGDKSYSVIFDNSKIKRLVPDYVASIPFAQGIREIINWYQADPSRQKIDPIFDQLCDRIIADYLKASPI